VRFRTKVGLGWVSALDVEGRTIWIVDAHGYGKRFIVRADEKLTAFVELECSTQRIWKRRLSSFVFENSLKDLAPECFFIRV
jgi:hypothetical protein